MDEFTQCINNLDYCVKHLKRQDLIKIILEARSLLFEYQIEINELKGVLKQRIEREIESSKPRGLPI